jgi:N-acyl homoserine lactone hydrolase
MTQVVRLWPLLTGLHRYDKSLSTRNRGHGETIEAPILAYLIETKNGRILYDVGCDYAKIADPALRDRYYDPASFPFGPPEMREEDRIPHHLERLGLTACDVCGAEVHVQQDELDAARSGLDVAVFPDDLAGTTNWKVQQGEYELVPGVRAVASPGHTAGHMSLLIELPKGPPVILCGDAADLAENLEQEIAPGLCWQDREEQALASIRKLKQLARQEKADLWPNHDLAFWRTLRRFPEFHE